MANFLIVDDDPIVTKLLEAALQKHGHSPVIASDGYSAVEIIKKELFDLVVCDVNMPGGFSGFNFVSTMRADKEIRQVPVLFLSGRREKKDIEKAIRAGGDDYLIKPVDFDLFFAKVGALLSRTSTHDFADVNVQANATWNLNLKVVGISEQGLSFRGLLALPVNMQFKIECDLFDVIGIDPPQMRVATCAEEEQNRSYLVRAAFVGLSTAELQKIRVWSMASGPKSRKAS